ncbi:MAG TPA: HEAT repeat domain-containing protein [Rubrobacteraceae bacterium]|nr:HEAT repeat domain-containing protein [Rubrobacteraceae bacterium]
MQDLGIILWVIVVMGVLNVMMIAGTFGVKAVRAIEKRRTKLGRERLESALADSLANDEIHEDLRRLGNRDLDLLAALMVEYLSLLRGAERDRLVRLAEKAGLVERYLDALRARNRWRRARAAENLGYFGGPDVAAPIARLLENQDETVRAVAARALARIGTPEAAAALARTLNDFSELTRLRMAENLERIGPLAVEPLIETLREGNPAARLLAVRVLGNLRSREARPVLQEVLREGAFPDLRAQAALALGKVGDPEDVPALLEAAEDEAWPVRTQAASALGKIGDVSTVPTLQRLTLDPQWWVRLNASRSLANMGPAGEKALTRLLEVEDRYTRDRAAATLEERGITRRVVRDLDAAGERGERARAMIRAMVRAGAVRYLERLARTFPDREAREALRRTIREAREP